MQLAISTFQDNWNGLEAATSTDFQLATLALTPIDIRHRHQHHHRGGLSKNTATDRVANSCHRNNPIENAYQLQSTVKLFVKQIHLFEDCTA